ncbi:Rod binding domain-containing protein [Rhizobium paknamense]|uniref:Rod binding domain-containing protein n=1 Tax=Rhizobium paknamense TaxID=1206817 RepID=A0ABU0IHA9_9HYPH|nr:Rod binding domain-containing protein [Rhizobium paknamense]
MAISPPSDLVLDVVRAADPSAMADAQQKLQSARAAVKAASLNEKSAGFDVAMNTMNSAASRAGLGNATSHIKTEDIPKPYRQYEGVILQNFVQSMLPKDSEAVFGKGNAGAIWKSMMAEQIGNTIAERGGIGIAKQMYSEQLSKMRDKGTQNVVADADANKMAEMQLHQIERDALGLLQTDQSTTTQTA